MTAPDPWATAVVAYLAGLSVAEQDALIARARGAQPAARRPSTAVPPGVAALLSIAGKQQAAAQRRQQQHPGVVDHSPDVGT